MYQNDWEEFRAMLCSEENRPLWIITPLVLLSLTVAGILFSRYTPMDTTDAKFLQYSHKPMLTIEKEIIKTNRYRNINVKKRQRTFWNMTLRNIKRMYPTENQKVAIIDEAHRGRVKKQRTIRSRVMKKELFSSMSSSSSFHNRHRMLRMAAQVVALKSTNMFPDLSDTALGAQVR